MKKHNCATATRSLLYNLNVIEIMIKFNFKYNRKNHIEAPSFTSGSHFVGATYNRGFSCNVTLSQFCKSSYKILATAMLVSCRYGKIQQNVLTACFVVSIYTQKETKLGGITPIRARFCPAGYALAIDAHVL